MRVRVRVRVRAPRSCVSLTFNQHAKLEKPAGVSQSFVICRLNVYFTRAHARVKVTYISMYALNINSHVERDGNAGAKAIYSQIRDRA